MKRKIDIEVPFKFCRKCERYKLKEDSYRVDSFGDKEIELNDYSCDYYEICKNAIKLFRESYEFLDKGTPEQSKKRLFSYLENKEENFEENKND